MQKGREQEAQPAMLFILLRFSQAASTDNIRVLQANDDGAVFVHVLDPRGQRGGGGYIPAHCLPLPIPFALPLPIPFALQLTQELLRSFGKHLILFPRNAERGFQGWIQRSET